MTSDDRKRYLIIIITLAILIGIGAFVSRYQKQASPDVSGITTEETTDTSAEPTIAASKIIAFEGKTGENVLTLLKKDHQVEVEDSPAGAFVNAIDGTKNTESDYWMYYVNNEPGEVAADQYPTKDGDKVEWRYESL